ncbi:MAG: hypothetical protein IJR45_05320 [Firmicutes bacterium]|nr:hypothetical protein [Bacillota bacterium]
MLRKKRLIVAMLALCALMSACSKSNSGNEQPSGSDNEIVLSDENKEEPVIDEDDEDDDEDDMLEKPAEELRIDIKAAVVGDCTGIGFAPIMGWGEKDKNHEKYTLTVAKTADEVCDLIRNGEADIAIVPLDKALELYRTDKSVELLATNTYNNIYIADVTDSRKTKADLAGQAVYVADDGSLAANVAKSVIKNSAATVQTMPANEDIKKALAEGSINLAAVSEPYLTLAKMENDNIEMGPDVSEIWKEDHVSDIISSVLVARRDFVDANKDSIIYIIDDFKQSVNTVIHGVTKTLEWTSSFKIVENKSLAISTMKNCNYNFTDGMEMRAAVESFLDENSDFIGELPEDDFYYTEN